MVWNLGDIAGALGDGSPQWGSGVDLVSGLEDEVPQKTLKLLCQHQSKIGLCVWVK